MGIQGLLPLLKSIQKPCNLKKFAGMTIGVDAYGWLHRGTVTCAMELAMDKPTRKFVDFAMHRVRMLIHFGVIPFLVFDGDYLPSKAATEADRAKRREDSKKLGFELLNAGKASQASLEFQKAVDVTPEMARQLIDELKKTGIQYVVAPYEADAQMVYLERKGIIQGILSEDSDLLVFGAKCLLTKLDQYGNCIEINKADFCRCREVNLTGWSDIEFRTMAILSGCDYLNSVNNMGLKTAYRMVRKYKNIEKVVKMLQFDGKYRVPEKYLEAFYQAELTFLHQRVFCPISDQMVLHTEPAQPLDFEKMPFIGQYIEPALARGVAIGELHPMTKQPMLRGTNQENASRTTLRASRTTWAVSRPQPQRVITSTNLKKGVSIEEFFKPKRIPLAELDPNCFTPSPSQQNALFRNPVSWASDPVPRPYLSRAATDMEFQSQSPPSFTQPSRSLPPSGPNIGNPRPSKRTRLCADEAMVDNLAESQRDAIERSRFFKSPTADISPSIGRAVKPKRSKREDITMFSDDSIEEALLNLPDFDGWHKIKPKHKSINIFEETDINVGASGHVLDDTSHVGTRVRSTVTTGDSQITIPSLTQSSSVLSSAEEPPTPVENTNLPALNDSKGKFTFTPPSTSILRRPLQDLSTPPSSAKQSRIPRPVKSVISAVTSAKTSPTRVLKPLQSLGTKALNRSSILPPTPPYTPIGISARVTLMGSTIKPRSALGVPFPEVACSSTLKTILKPCDIPLPPIEKDEAQALATEFKAEGTFEIRDITTEVSAAKGSEDFIVHDSEEELEHDNLESVKSPREVPKLDLKGFVFQAR